MTFIVSGSDGGTFPSWTTATRPASPAVGQMGYNTTTGLFDQYVGSAWQSVSIGTGAVPQVTSYTSGSGTYTTPAGAKFLAVKMAGAGGGGATSGPGQGAGGSGGTTTFGSSLLTCTGGGGGTTAPNSAASTGGTPTISSPAFGIGYTGGQGSGGSEFNVAGYSTGMMGGTNIFGGGGSSASNSVGSAGAVNTGAGGGGAGSAATGTGTGGGGGAGAAIEAYIPTPSATYSYAVGAGGSAGTSGQFNGGAGAAGVIIVTAYF